MVIFQFLFGLLMLIALVSIFLTAFAALFFLFKSKDKVQAKRWFIFFGVSIAVFILSMSITTSINSQDTFFGVLLTMIGLFSFIALPVLLALLAYSFFKQKNKTNVKRYGILAGSAAVLFITALTFTDDAEEVAVDATDKTEVSTEETMEENKAAEEEARLAAEKEKEEAESAEKKAAEEEAKEKAAAEEKAEAERVAAEKAAAEEKAEAERVAAEKAAAEKAEAERVAAEKAAAEKAEAKRVAAEKAAAAAVPTESFQNCTELNQSYPNGVSIDHPAYQGKMDRDKDNWACEQ